MTTRLIEVRGPSADEAQKGAEITFVRCDSDGVHHSIKACVTYESWSQWGVSTDILGDNVEAVEAWRRGLDDVLAMVEEEDFFDEANAFEDEEEDS